MRKPHPLTGFITVRGRRAGFTFEDAAQADYAVERALAGDLQPIADRVRSGKKLLPEECAIAADLLDGTREMKNPAHRPASDETRKQEMLLALAVWQRMKLGEFEKIAVKAVSAAEGKGERTVRAAVQAHPEMFAGLKRRKAAAFRARK
jgi:hypothetical protein